MTAEICKVEYHILDEDGDAFEWIEEDGHATEQRAIAHAKEHGGHSVKRVTSYFEDKETVWKKDDEADA